MRFFENFIAWFLIIITLTLLGTSLYFLYRYINSLSFILLLSFQLINFIISWILFLQKRQTKGKLSWLLIFVSMPFIGHILFIFFGQRYKFRTTKEIYFKKENFKYEIKNNFESDDKDLENIIKKQINLSKRFSYDSNITFFSNGSNAMEKLFEDIKQAKKFIHLNHYIIKPGEMFDELKTILLQKAKEGIQIKFLIDDFGRWALPWHEIKYLRKKGIEVVIFGKVYFPFIGSYNGYRMHRKSTIIDGNICHSGGINIADEYVNLSKKYGLWVDCQIRITGKGVRSHSLLFIDLWNYTTKQNLDYKKYLNENNENNNSSILLVEDSPEIIEPLIERSLLNLIYNAKKSITLVTPYLIPTEKLMEAIKSASLSGIKIKIFIPGKADKKTIFRASDYYAKILSQYGVQIYKTNNIYIHSKMGLFDSKYAYLGSANLDNRTLFAQWEIIQILTGQIVKDIKNEINEYLSFSTLLNFEEIKQNKILNFIIKIYVNILSPIM